MLNSARIIPDRFFRRHGWQCRLCLCRSLAGRTSHVCVHRCVQDPQQVVTRNRGGYAAARWLPIRQGLCVPSRAPPSAVAAPVVLGKSGVFPLLSLFRRCPRSPLARSGPKRSSLGCCAGKPCSILAAAGTPATFRDWNNALVN